MKGSADVELRGTLRSLTSVGPVGKAQGIASAGPAGIRQHLWDRLKVKRSEQVVWLIGFSELSIP